MKIKNTKIISRNNILTNKMRFPINFLAYIITAYCLISFTNENNKLNNPYSNSLNEPDSLQENNSPSLNFITDLTSSNIHSFFDNSDSMLILFIEPNCLKCNRFTKILLELNEKISKENTELKRKVKFATVNGFQEKQIVEKLNVEEIPSFLFINKKLNYEQIISDVQSTNEIYEFLKRKIIRKWNFLESLQQVNDFREKRINLIVCRNEKSEIHSEFFQKLNMIIAKYEDVNYYVVNLYKHKSDMQKLEKEYQGRF
jgi:hypothetical protein